ncbi:MAG TPA: hypothetical protein DCP62_00150 [Erysipelotrichaceae bacterium]|nr:hypothetical protein [Erysipelotrichaceae bacterium]
MGSLTVHGKNTAATQLGLAYPYMALFTDDAGTVELVGYTRPACNWGAPSNGVINLTAALTIDVPAGASIKSFGPISALSGGNLGGVHNAGDETFTNAGKYQITSCPLTVT